MMRSILKRLARRHGTAVAYLALFAALGGSAYAAVTVTGKNIKDGTVTGRDVKNSSLGTGKLSPSAVSSLTGQPGPAGPQGEKGAAGPAGATGPAGPTGPKAKPAQPAPPAQKGRKGPAVSKAQAGSAAGNTGSQTACVSGSMTMGRRGSLFKRQESARRRPEQHQPPRLRLNNRPIEPGTGWVVTAYSKEIVPATVYAWVICANVTS